MRLYLIRHPRPIVAPGLCYGRTDLTVAPDEVARVTDDLSALLPTHTPIYSSLLQRCTGLAQALAQRLECRSVRFDARLAEMDFGAWEMQAWDAIARAEIDAWAAGLSTYRPGGGESVTQMALRISACMDDLLKPAAPQAGAIVVCHAGSIRLMQAYALGLPPEGMALHAAQNLPAPGYGQLQLLDI